MPTPIIASLDDIAAGYNVLLCDLWGCLHDGVAPFPSAIAALERFRARGGAVILLTNAPRPSGGVKRHLDAMGAPRAAYDQIASSGDAARAALASGDWGQRCVHVGPERDRGLFAGLDLTPTDPAQADFVLCSGLYDDAVETPGDYADAIADWAAHGLRMLCANPDVVVDRGGERIYCAGAVAQAYAAAGGEVTCYGKPHAPIYRHALSLAETLRGATPGGSIAPGRVLAIGDGIATDIAGAAGAGIDSLFIAGGIAAPEVAGACGRIDKSRLRTFLERHSAAPRAAMWRLS